MTETTFDATTGPVLANIRSLGGAIRIATDPTRRAARVVVRTDDTSGPAADAVRNTRIRQDGHQLHIDIPEIPGNSISFANGGMTVTGNVNSIVAQSVSGVTIINGRVVSDGSTQPVVAAVELLLQLPLSSGVHLETDNADTEILGGLAALDATAHNGSLHADVIGRIKWRGHNGSLRIGALADTADIESHNGTTLIDSYTGNAAVLRTHNGGIHVQADPTASGRLEARSHNGDIRLTGARHLDVQTSTRNGHVSK